MYLESCEVEKKKKLCVGSSKMSVGSIYKQLLAEVQTDAFQIKHDFFF